MSRATAFDHLDFAWVPWAFVRVSVRQRPSIMPQDGILD